MPRSPCTACPRPQPGCCDEEHGRRGPSGSTFVTPRDPIPCAASELHQKPSRTCAMGWAPLPRPRPTCSRIGAQTVQPSCSPQSRPCLGSAASLSSGPLLPWECESALSVSRSFSDLPSDLTVPFKGGAWGGLLTAPTRTRHRRPSWSADDSSSI